MGFMVLNYFDAPSLRPLVDNCFTRVLSMSSLAVSLADVRMSESSDRAIAANLLSGGGPPIFAAGVEVGCGGCGGLLWLVWLFMKDMR